MDDICGDDHGFTRLEKRRFPSFDFHDEASLHHMKYFLRAGMHVPWRPCSCAGVYWVCLGCCLPFFLLFEVPSQGLGKFRSCWGVGPGDPRVQWVRLGDPRGIKQIAPDDRHDVEDRLGPDPSRAEAY